MCPMQLLPTCTVLVLWLAATVKGEDVLVTVEQGTLRGTTATGVYNTPYTAFLGIPYAAPPLGDLRFEPPQPVSGWEGVRDATEYGSDCVQEDASGSEDCLYLNVFVPGVPEEGAGLPVLVYVHGGAFVNGSGSNQKFGPDFLVTYGIILVTINYRLGPFGFLSCRDMLFPGNAGLKDQRQALLWVQANIARFGGDPQLVTLDGRSAGGVAVSLHLTSAQSAGLFSRLVDQSGTFVASWSMTRDARSHAFKLGSVLGYEAENSEQLVQFLRSLNATDLLVDQSLLMSDEQKLYYAYSVWAPLIEPDIEGAFVRESPILMVNAGVINKVPIMIGVTSAESGAKILSDSELVTDLNENFVAVVGPSLHLQSKSEQAQAAVTVRDFYFGNDTISLDNPEPLVHQRNDMDFFEATDALVRKIVEVTDVPVYYYEFDYRGENVPQNEWGVEHGGEQGFLFYHNNHDINYNLDPESEEDQVRRNMLRLWTNFMKYGNPTPEADPVIWEPYDLTNRSYLLMQANVTLAHNRLAERMDFWNLNVPLEEYPWLYR